MKTNQKTNQGKKNNNAEKSNKATNMAKRKHADHLSKGVHLTVPKAGAMSGKSKHS